MIPNLSARVEPGLPPQHDILNWNCGNIWILPYQGFEQFQNSTTNLNLKLTVWSILHLYQLQWLIIVIVQHAHRICLANQPAPNWQLQTQLLRCSLDSPSALQILTNSKLSVFAQAQKLKSLFDLTDCKISNFLSIHRQTNQSWLSINGSSYQSPPSSKNFQDEWKLWIHFFNVLSRWFWLVLQNTQVSIHSYSLFAATVVPSLVPFSQRIIISSLDCSNSSAVRILSNQPLRKTPEKMEILYSHLH